MTAGSDHRRARFVVSYRGNAFHGAAESDGVRTVVGELRGACEQILSEPISLTLAGRTDAGVHAIGQVISCDLPMSADPADLAHRLNRMCGPDIAVRSGEWAADDFDARFSATSRHYRYHVWNSATPNPLLTELAWHVPHALDIDAMNRGASYLLGEHDFASFCRLADPTADGTIPSTVRVVFSAKWSEGLIASLLQFDITGSAFCHQMVRSIVGTLVDVGRGKISSTALEEILAARQRQAAGQVAPPTGLVLWSVGYDGERIGPKTR